MAEQGICTKCYKRDGCIEVCERLGGADVPSVAGKSVLAFLLPLVVFAVVLWVFDRFLGGFIEWELLSALTGLLAAGSASLAFVLLVRILMKAKASSGCVS